MATEWRTGNKDMAAIEARAMNTLTQRGWKPDYMVVRRQADYCWLRLAMSHWLCWVQQNWETRA